jgi:hypothetical protein
LRRNDREYGYTYYRTDDDSRASQNEDKRGGRRGRRNSPAPRQIEREGSRT